MLYVSIINCILTAGIVYYAFMQWKCSENQRKIQLFQYRIGHIQELKTLWNKFCNDVDFVVGNRAKYIRPENYNNKYYEMSRFLDTHAEFTKCYFGENLYQQEIEIINLLFELLPPSYQDFTSLDMDKKKFEMLNNKISNFCKIALKEYCN